MKVQENIWGSHSHQFSIYIYVSGLTTIRKFKWQDCHDLSVCFCSLNPRIEIWHVFDTHGCSSASQICSTSLYVPAISKTIQFVQNMYVFVFKVRAARQSTEKTLLVSQRFGGGPIPPSHLLNQFLYSAKVSHVSCFTHKKLSLLGKR